MAWLITFIAAPVTASAQNVPPGQISNAAFTVVSSRVGALRSSFYVYRDADSGENHGFPSGFFGNNQASMVVLPGCVDDPSATSGVSTDTTRLDRQRGTVTSIKFGPQGAGAFAGLNIEEPENWGANLRPASNGYDLRGATNLVFDVRSPTSGGITVQFGVGGGVTSYRTIPQSATYTTLTIPLASLNPSPDLSDVHILFSVAVNHENTPAGGTLLVDNIRFDPAPNSRASALGFPLATQTFGIIPSLIKPFPLDQVLRNVTGIYESALTMGVLLARRLPSDLDQVRLIADTFHYALAHENHGDALPAASGGYVGLHNGYISGDIGLFNNQTSPKTGLAGDIRIAGFTCSTNITPSGYAAVLDGATGGNNAFAILALAAAYKHFNNPQYLSDAKIIGNWIYAQLLDQSGNGYGGYFVGYDDKPSKPLLTGKSTENNADIFKAFLVLSVIDSANSAEWIRRANIAGDFVMRMFDATGGHFYAGTTPAIVNGTQGEVINTFDFLDTNTFTTLAMADSPRYTAQIDWRRPVQYCKDHFAKTVTTGLGAFQGFSLVETPGTHDDGNPGADGIAWEFTGQMIVTMRFVDALYHDTRFEVSAQFYLNQISNAQNSAPFGDGLGLVAATLQNGDALPPLDQGLQTPYQDIPERVGLAATTWAILADKNLNIFKLLDLTSQFLNISTRLNVLTGDNALIGGFIITGSAPKKVIVRALGPSLGLTGALADPTLELHFPDGTTLLSNDNWKVNPLTGLSQESDIRATTIPPSNDLESAIVATLAPNAYTAIVRGKNQTTGVGLVEVYDLATATNSKLANISARGFVGLNNDVLIGGTIIGSGTGVGTSQVLIRALGPSLSSQVSGVLQDPTLELRDANGTIIASNDNWKDTQESAIQATTIPPPDDKESAILQALPAGAYTAIVRGKSSWTGIGLVEFYSID